MHFKYRHGITSNLATLTNIYIFIKQIVQRKIAQSGVKQNNPNPIFPQKTNELNSFDDVV